MQKLKNILIISTKREEEKEEVKLAEEKEIGVIVMNKEEHVQVITDREELYDKCENMEQLFDKYYLPLLDKHYSKTYEIQQENKKYKEVIDKIRKICSNVPYDWSVCGIDVVHKIENILKEVK